MIQRANLDETDIAILAALQKDARMSIADLARAVHLSSSSTSERFRRLLEEAVIAGFSTELSPEALGYSVQAFVRLSYPSGNYKPFHDLIASTPEIVEAHHVTGDDCFIIKVYAQNMLDLERITGKLSTLGRITTNVVYSSPLQRRPLSPTTERPTAKRRTKS